FVIIDISSADSGQMALRISDAINGSGVRIDATLFGTTGIVELTNRQPTAKGNQTITDGVGTPIFVVTPTMSGGQAGNCDAGGCAVDADCTSNRCVSGTCQMCTTDNQCASNLCRNNRCAVCTTIGNNECGGSRTCVAGKCQ